MIFVCGEALFDVFLDSGAGNTRENAEVTFHAQAAGSPFNVAVGLARSGCNVALITEIGNDELGRRIGRCLSARGVNQELVQRSDKSTPIAFVELDQGTPRYRFVGLRDCKYDPDEQRILDMSDESSMFHVGSYALVASGSADALIATVGNLASRLLISVDPNVRLQVEPDTDKWRAGLDRFGRQAHLVKLSEEDVESLYGKAIDVERIAEQLLTGNCQIVILTKGSSGATIFSRSGNRISIPACSVSVVDSVGAGDAFQAATLAWLECIGATTADALTSLSSQDLYELGEFSSRIASIVCGRKGAEFPQRAERQATLPRR